MTEKSRSRIPQVWLALLGLVIAVVLAGGTFGGWLIAANADGPSASASRDDDDEDDDSDEVAAEPIDKIRDLNHTFKSQSGNIQCSVGEFSGEPGAICKQLSINYAVPAEVCPGNQGGVYIGLAPDGAYWPCVSNWWEPDEVLPYDTPITQSGVTCAINFETGVTCTNEEGKGFSMEFTAGVATF